MLQRNIVFYLPAQNKRDFPYISEKSADRHREFISYFPSSVQFYLAIHEEQYIGINAFNPQFIRIGDTWKINTRDNIEADLILGMSAKVESEKIYHNEIKEFCRDKTQIENIFPKYSFRSEICNSYGEIITKSQNIPSKMKVYKPCFGSQAKGIIISKSLPKDQDLEGEYPYLIQEFIDTLNGFEGYTGIHDFRVIILNGKITGSFLRVAPDGVMTANVATGAKIIDFYGNIPEQIQRVINQVESYIAPLYPERYYSIDTCIGKNGEVKIFELNSNPMLSTPSIIEGLAQHIIKNILKIS